MDSLRYLAVMAFCVLVTLPLEFVIGARVYRNPGRLARVLVPVLVVFFVWDVVAIRWGHWSFDPRYVTGWKFPGRVPLEEVVFFLVIPLCGLLTFEAVRRIRDK
ncbi:MAG: lycopene cyclase domain-containing protein [Acidimicrobiia bacterium]